MLLRFYSIEKRLVHHVQCNISSKRWNHISGSPPVLVCCLRFPLYHHRKLKKWLSNMNMKDWTPSRFSVLCSNHFEEQHIDRMGKNVKLKDDAVPTIFLPLDETPKTTVSFRVFCNIQRNSENNIFIEHCFFHRPSCRLQRINEIKDLRWESVTSFCLLLKKMLAYIFLKLKIQPYPRWCL